MILWIYSCVTDLAALFTFAVTLPYSKSSLALSLSTICTGLLFAGVFITCLVVSLDLIKYSIIFLFLNKKKSIYFSFFLWEVLTGFLVCCWCACSISNWIKNTTKWMNKQVGYFCRFSFFSSVNKSMDNYERKRIHCVIPWKCCFSLLDRFFLSRNSCKKKNMDKKRDYSVIVWYILLLKTISIRIHKKNIFLFRII